MMCLMKSIPHKHIERATYSASVLERVTAYWNDFISKIEFKSRNELDKTDRQRNEARIGVTLKKKKDSGFRKEEG